MLTHSKDEDKFFYKLLRLFSDEPYLQIAAATENKGLYNGENRSRDPKIDIIFRVKTDK